MHHPRHRPQCRERRLRYCARPPLALERMSLEHGTPYRTTGGGPEERGAGPEEPGPGETDPIRRVLYLPARPLPDGRSVLALSPLEFLAALARLIPPPRVHRHRYHGVLAPNARLRSRVVALAKEHTAALTSEGSAPDLCGPTLDETAGNVDRAAAATGPPDAAAPAMAVTSLHHASMLAAESVAPSQVSGLPGPSGEKVV